MFKKAVLLSNGSGMLEEIAQSRSFPFCSPSLVFNLHFTFTTHRGSSQAPPELCSPYHTQTSLQLLSHPTFAPPACHLPERVGFFLETSARPPHH